MELVRIWKPLKGFVFSVFRDLFGRESVRRGSFLISVFSENKLRDLGRIGKWGGLSPFDLNTCFFKVQV